MLLSLAFIFIIGMTLGKVFARFKLPSLVGMLLTGIFIGPYVLNILDPTILGISTELRKIALIIILTRAGLNLDIEDLKKVGRPAILMCCIPACFEIAGMILLAPVFLDVTYLEAAIMGTVVAAVSPAVIVPRMLTLMENGYGRDQSIPQMIMASGSVDDVFVIVLFTACTSLAQGTNVSAMNFLVIPTSIIFGLLVGIALGYILNIIFTKIHIRDTEKVLILLSISFILVTIEDYITGNIGFSGLLAIMAMGATIQNKRVELSRRLSEKFTRLWSGAEILLFVLVGATVNIQYALKAGVAAIILILCVLVFRVFGVFVCLIKTKLNKKERIFSAMAYMP
ncbi:MAG: cation:proton antiporter, partial [Eubacteriales bacterium]